jgi:hypothetical protein
MSTNTRWMISLGWGIPTLVALTIIGLRPTLSAMGEYAGGILLFPLVIPTFLLALGLLTAGSVSGLRTWRTARYNVGTGDRALLAAGLLGALIGWYGVIRSVVSVVRLGSP